MKSFNSYLSKSANDYYQSDSPRSPKIGISQLQKKFYPLNFTLASAPFEEVQTNKKKYERSPAFIDEFLSFTPKNATKTGCKINTRNTLSCGFGYLDYSLDPPTRDLHPPVCVDIPPVSYNSIKVEKAQRKKLDRKEEMYHPNVVSFSQRSKMILYSQTPMVYLPPPEKKFRVKGMELRTKYLQAKASKKYENLNKPQNFEQKLRRLKEIIKDPLIYEN